ncbi:TetR/AcrR family transcriptional regulator [Thermodesulfobacteriota bacterium]
MIDNKTKIIDAAEDLMSQNGLEGSSITEIAKKAGVAESLIYNYFKGKEDILFHVPQRKLQQFFDEGLKQLEGIPEPISRLSKLIWWQLHYNDTYRDYARLLILECRSNRNYYKHEAYLLSRKYAGVMLGILEDGVKEQVFREDVNMRLVRDIIFGTIESEAVSCLAANEVKETVPDLKAILDLILPMITIPKSTVTMEKDKSNRILKAAEAIFAEKGYNRTTISEIAKSANVSDATIYEYFKNKEDLLLSIPKQRLRKQVNSLKDVFEIKDPLRKVRRLLRYHFVLYLMDINYMKVFLLLIQLNERFYKSPVYEMFKEYTTVITDTIDEGKKAGSIRSNVNTRVFKNMFLGAFSHIALRWVIVENKREPDKMKEIDDLVTLLNRAIANNED